MAFLEISFIARSICDTPRPVIAPGVGFGMVGKSSKPANAFHVSLLVNRGDPGLSTPARWSRQHPRFDLGMSRPSFHHINDIRLTICFCLKTGVASLKGVDVWWVPINHPGRHR